jgi:hypothetical protein
MIRFEGAVVLVVLAVYAPASGARQANQKTFSSPEEAVAALVTALQDRDENALLRILGGKEELFSLSEESEDELDRQLFLEKFKEMHRVASEPGGTVLYVGAENWPFPIPLTSSDGAWSFDTEAGLDEILFRRIGANESSAIDICRALARSDEDAATFVEAPVPVQGYYFRALPARGRPASFVAYPAEYGSSGVMTFVVHHDVMYERDLGPGTASAAKAMVGYKPNSTWHALQ